MVSVSTRLAFDTMKLQKHIKLQGNLPLRGSKSGFMLFFFRCIRFRWPIFHQSWVQMSTVGLEINLSNLHVNAGLDFNTKKFKNHHNVYTGSTKKNKATTRSKIERKVLNLSCSTLTCLFQTKFCTFNLQKMLKIDLKKPSYIYPKLLYRFSKWTKRTKNSVNFLMHYFTLFLKDWIM